ncbi:MAG: NADH:ubiquinone reductase (Na(+)-transporting) subunit F [Candidatus Rifleibacteriota bacterium]
MQFLTAFLMVNGFILVLCSLIVLSSRLLKQGGTAKLWINEREPVEVECGSSLFDALTETDIYLPAACGGKGTCGRCLVRCLQGGGPVTPMERLNLEKRFLEEGYRLACQVKVRTDIQIELPAEMLSARKFTAILRSAEFCGEGIRILNFELENNETLEFKPGQYVQVYLDLPHERVVRAYSISSPSFRKNGFSLDVQFVAGGIMSGYLHELEPEQRVEISGPYGDMAFTDSSNAEFLILVAGGVGLAPIRSILYGLLALEEKPQVYLFVGARHRANLYLEAELNKLAEENKDWLRYYPALSGDLIEEGWTGYKGFIHEIVKEKLPSIKRAKAFICGPAAMMNAVTEVLVEKGLAREDIKADPFDFNRPSDR